MVIVILFRTLLSHEGEVGRVADERIDPELLFFFILLRRDDREMLPCVGHPVAGGFYRCSDPCDIVLFSTAVCVSAPPPPCVCSLVARESVYAIDFRYDKGDSEDDELPKKRSFFRFFFLFFSFVYVHTHTQHVDTQETSRRKKRSEAPSFLLLAWWTAAVARRLVVFNGYRASRSSLSPLPRSLKSHHPTRIPRLIPPLSYSQFITRSAHLINQTAANEEEEDDNALPAPTILFRFQMEQGKFKSRTVHLYRRRRPPPPIQSRIRWRRPSFLCFVRLALNTLLYSRRQQQTTTPLSKSIPMDSIIDRLLQQLAVANVNQ